MPPKKKPVKEEVDEAAEAEAAAARAREEKEEKDNELGQRLRDAVRKGDEAGLQRAIRDKARLDWADAAGWTALHYACRAGHQQAASLLISTGASVGLRDVRGMSPLLFAAKNGHMLILKLLVHAGGDIQAADDTGSTALHHAAHRGHDQEVAFLVEMKADVHAQNEEGKTALHLVAEESHSCRPNGQNILRTLVHAGADGQNTKDVNGFSAEDCSSSPATRAMIQYLTPGRHTECLMRQKKEATSVFNVLDTDGSGTLSITELAQSLESVGCEAHQLKAMFSLIDGDGVDKDGKIDSIEFTKHFAQYSQYLYLLPAVMKLRRVVPPPEHNRAAMFEHYG